jgi:hypothetical protein
MHDCGGREIEADNQHGDSYCIKNTVKALYTGAVHEGRRGAPIPPPQLTGSRLELPRQKLSRGNKATLVGWNGQLGEVDAS